MAAAAWSMLCSIYQAIAPSLQLISSIQFTKTCSAAFNSASSEGHLLWRMDEIHARIPP